MQAEYLIVAKVDVNLNEFTEMLRGHGVKILEDFGSLRRHYHIQFEDSLFETINAESDVLSIDENRTFNFLTNQTINVSRYGYGDNWGLSRICNRDEWDDSTWYPNSGEYTYFRDGTNVDVYIVDTGARLTHSEFTGRIDVIFDYYQPKTSASYGVDQQGHGTHVAATVAGTKYGVAKKAQIKISRVFETGGATLSAIIAGVNACLSHHNNKKVNFINRPSIMNLSLGGGANATEEQAINDCIDSGIVIVAAAGNESANLNSPSYDVFPAEIVRAITVGSVDIQDKMSSFSNYGEVVDVFAPGHYITAAGFESDEAESMLSGTSMATPHVVGVCALYCQDRDIGHNGSDVSLVHDWIRDNATPSTLVLSSQATNAGSPNKMLFSDFDLSFDAGQLPGADVPDDSTDDTTTTKPGKGKTDKEWRGKKKTRTTGKFVSLLAALKKISDEKGNGKDPKIAKLFAELEHGIGEVVAGSKRESIIGYYSLIKTVSKIKSISKGDETNVNSILTTKGHKFTF